MRLSPWTVGGILAAAALLWPKKAQASGGGTVGATPQQRKDFAARLWAALGRVRGDLSPGAKALIIAHGAYETGWGLVGTAPSGHNYWNTTVGKAQYRAPGSTWVKGAGTPGKDKDGNGRPIDQTWRSFPTDDDALRDFLSTFVGPSPHSLYPEAYVALNAFNGNVTDYAAALRKRGYFTAPLAEYTTRLQAVYASVLSALGATGKA